MNSSRGNVAADLIDFFNRWAEFRDTAVHIAEIDALKDDEKQIIHWLIALSDRVSHHDLSLEKQRK